METATLSGGCFWCTQAIFQRLKGVASVMSGYAGGKITDPTYQQVSSGATGHAESIQLVFDPNIITYPKILEIFFATHDPTTPDQQGNDVGSQYRSMIFYHNDTQKSVAEDLIKKLSTPNPIVTQLVPFTNFYPAEDHHQNFYEKNPNHTYCQLVINPKVKKLIAHYSNDLKPEYQI